MALSDILLDAVGEIEEHEAEAAQSPEYAKVVVLMRAAAFLRFIEGATDRSPEADAAVEAVRDTLAGLDTASVEKAVAGYNSLYGGASDQEE